MAKKSIKKAVDPFAQNIAQAENDSELLDGLLDYLEAFQGSLDLIQENMEPSEKSIPEIGLAPENALDNAVADLNSKTIQVRAKRALASDITLPGEGEIIH